MAKLASELSLPGVFPIYERVLIGSAESPRAAFEAIASRWDTAPYEGEPFNGSYEFEIDGHRFVVSVSPIAY